MNFHDYDPYYELENTKRLVNKLIEINNQTQLVIQNLTNVTDYQAGEITRLKIKLDQLSQQKLPAK